jgi:hypothetical protein
VYPSAFYLSGFVIVLSSEPGQRRRLTGAASTVTSCATTEALDHLLGVAMII